MKKITVVILASGFSKRFNGNKLLVNFKEKTLIEHTFDHVENITSQVVVVTQYDRVKEIALNYGYDVVLNSHPELGQSYSIQLGINYASNVDGWLLMVGDLPMVKKETLHSLIKLFNQGDGRQIVVTSFNGIMQNPMIISSSYKQELLQLEGDQGAKKVFSKHLQHVACVKVTSDVELMDIDSQEDLHRLEVYIEK